MSNLAKNHKKNLDPELISEALLIINELKLATIENDLKKLKELEKKKDVLLKLFEFILSDLLNPQIDPYLLEFLLKYLGIKHPKSLLKTTLLEKEKEDKIKKEEKELLHRLIIYEIYKALCPRVIAGETEIDNFINNTRTRGIEYAIKYAAPEIAEHFKRDASSNNKGVETPLARKSFVDLISKEPKANTGRNI